MKFNKWTLGLAAVGVVSLVSAVKAEEGIVNMAKTAVSGTTISGMVDTSFEYTDGSLGSLGSGFRGMPMSGIIPFRSGKADGFNLNVVEINIAKPLDETVDWSSGYKVSLLYGPDAVGYNQSANVVNGRHATGSDFAIKEAYVALRAPVGNGLDLKMGVFNSPLGYETFESGKNPNFTRSYGYAIEPTQLTGLLATYHVNDSIAISAGIANTLSAGINTRPNSPWDMTAIGSLTLTAPQNWGFLSGSSFAAGIVDGWDARVEARRLNLYAGMTMPTGLKGLSVGTAFDYTAFDQDRTEVDAWTLAAYATWQATEKASLNLRGEYGLGTSTKTWYSGSKYQEGEVFAITGTFQYNLWANVISRLELRWDRMEFEQSRSHSNYYSTQSSEDFVNQITLALNVIYTF